jgi:hypothetical protein
VNLLCKLLLFWSCLCCLLAIEVQAKDGQSRAGLHHHPPRDQLLHEEFYSTWHMPDNPSVSCCNDADCYPTEIKYVESNIYAKRREDGEYIRIPPEKVERNRDNPHGRNHICAPRRMSCTAPTPFSASHWEASHEIRIGEWQDALPAILMCAV